MARARAWALAFFIAWAATLTRAYLILVPDTAPPGHLVLDAAVYKLGSERTYTIDVHRTANFVHHVLRVNRTSGLVTLRKRLRCDGVLYPNLFTFYVDSTSERIRDIDYYSLPIRILVTGEDCSRRHADLYDIDFDRVYDQDDAALQYEDDHTRDKRETHYYKPEIMDWRLIEEEEELLSSQYKVLSTAYPWTSAVFEDFAARNRSRNKRSLPLPFDMAIDVKIAEAKQWISETYASFSIPTTDRWQGICLKQSQFINSLTAFLPRTVQKFCKVQFLDVSDPRFLIESSQGDLVASSDMCIQEPMWKVSVLFTFNCDKSNIVDSDHRLKIVYHHQELNDTDIARRVKRELRNQSPYFEQALYVASVAEEQPPGVVVSTVRARDPENSPVTYSMSSLLDSRSAGMFAVDTRSGVVTTQARLDRERLDVHYFRVVAQDDTFPPRSGTTTLQINVLDCNDHAPVFEMQQYEASVREGASAGTTVLTLKATDQDIGNNAQVEYTIDSVSADSLNPEEMNESMEGDNEQASTPDVFRVDGRSGALLTRAPLDREKVSRYTVIVKATDQASPVSDRLSSSATIHVNIIDDNDNYPQFSEKTYTVTVDEDISVSENPIIAKIKASDADVGANAAIRYAIIGGNTQMQFSIDSLSGDVALVKPLDYEQVRNYRLVIRAQDGGSPSRSNTTQLLVNVKDVNDNAPRFYTSLFQESVSENVPVGYSIVRVQAYDADEGVNAELTYTLADKEYIGNNDLPITIDPRSGWVYTSAQLDREVQPKYQLQVTATDGGVPPRSATASVVVVVQDVNDNDPVFSPPQYEVELAEDEPPGTPVVTVTATDADEDNRLHYEITGGNTRGRFSITSQNGRGLITVAQPLDFKQERRYVLTVTATDPGGRADTAMVHINITDANNYAPVFENAPYTASVFEDAPVGTTVLVVSATDSDVGVNAQITYSLSSEISNEAVAHHDREFLINPHTGAITTNKLLDRESMSGYLLTVTARDGGVPSLSDTTDVEISVVDVNDNAPVFKQQLYTSSIMEDALVGTSVTQVSASDADVGLNGRVHYELAAREREEGSFALDAASGVLRTNKPLDRESVAIYDLKALAIDGGTPPQSSSVIIHIKVEDINDSPPVFESDCLTFYIPENSPIGTTVGEIRAHDPDEGANAVIHYSIKGGDDSNSFSLETRQGSDKAELVTMVDLDYESPRKKYELVIRAASPPLWNDVRVEVLVTDVNDNAPMMKDFQIIFNNFKDCFPVGPFGRVPAYDADVSDKLQYRILSGNNANLVLLNETSGAMTLSPQLNTNVPKLATMEISVTDGVNEIKAMMQLSVRLITEEMLFNSITVRLNDMTAEQFLSPLLGFFIDGLAAIVPCPKENIYVFSVQDDTDVTGNILNVSFSARRPEAELSAGGAGGDAQFYSPTHLRERLYLNRATLARLATVQVLPFDDNVCIHEPCLNFEECLTVLKFGNATGFINSDSVLFRPIYPVTTFTCQCPQGFTGLREHFLCDTEVDLCYSSPCVNNGTCIRREGGYTCVCAAGFTGTNCETVLTKATCDLNGDGTICRSGSQCVARREGGILCQGCTIDAEYTTAMCELRARSFPASSFLTFAGLKRRHRFNFKLKFATTSPSGLLMYNGRYNERHDFVALETVASDAGKGGGEGLRFSFALGGAKTEVTVAAHVADGAWHTVEIQYYNRTATMILDNCDKDLSLAGANEFGIKYACANFTRKELPPRCDIPTETCHRHLRNRRFLDLTGPLQIGGLPNIPTSFQVKNKDFVGCISDVYIDHKFLDLNSYVSDNGTLAGCPQKRSRCSSTPCHRAANCTDLWDSFLCDCPEGYSGHDCSETTSPPWRFSGDGMLSFNPLLRPIQLPWLNALSLRTRQRDSFLMSVQIGQNSSVFISLKSGLLHYSYNGETMFLPSTNLADGNWHRVEIKWLGTDISVVIDYGLKSALLPMLANKIQGQYIGKILIGGPDTTAGLLASEVGYFEGCIQDVRVGTAQSLLNRPTVRENVRDGCQSKADCLLSICPPYSKCESEWDSTECVCERGRVGPQCVAACELRPCGPHAVCVPEDTQKGYSCKCAEGYIMTGEGCMEHHEEECPGGWWGVTGCGPCDCDAARGYHPHCAAKDGRCRCKENHYKSPEGEECVACHCYAAGSLNSSCEDTSGQCHCRSGVIGRACDSCSNLYAEVTPNAGCKVIYDGCPRSFSNGVWWPRTKFGVEAITDCPTGSSGRATRMCDEVQVVPWQEPDMFNCTTETFYQLRKQLHKIETGELTVNTFVGVRLAEEVWSACARTARLFGADVLVAEGILLELLRHELRQAGLNLTHSQDKDYVRNIIKSANTILNIEYDKEWQRIRKLTGHGVEHLLQKFDKYIAVLAESQHDTYTSPFEIVTSDLVIGVDIVTAESIYGFEPTQLNRYSGETITTERVVLPDTSAFIHSPIQPGYYSNGKTKTKKPLSPTVSFPKYNNYVKNKNKFDKYSRVLLPLDLLGINSNTEENMVSGYESRAVFAYMQYSRNTSQLLPLRTDDSVSRRWGINVTLGSPVLQLALFVPDQVWRKEGSENDSLDMNDIAGVVYANKGQNHQSQTNNIGSNSQSRNPWSHSNEDDNNENHGPIVIQPAFKKQDKVEDTEILKENNSTYGTEKAIKIDSDGLKVMALVMEPNDKTKDGINSSKEVDKKKQVYKSLSGIRLKKPIRLQIWLDINRDTFGSRTNPQCVHWSTLRGSGEWSRVGCHTEIDYDWSQYSDEPLRINCTCNHLSTFAVLVDEVDIELIPEPSLLESVTSYTAFSISLPLLLVTWAALCLMRGGAATVSNSIHKHLIFCVFMAELLYLIALKARNSLVQNEFGCKVIAMSLHYWWLAALGWAGCEAWQLRRLLRELRDVNHGGLAAPLAAAYAAPAVALALAAAHTPHQYGNALFCWVSCHEPVVWWVVVPAAVYAAVAVVFLAGATRAAFTVRDHVTGFGNLRMLLAISIICLPLLCVSWASALVLGSEAGERRNALSSLLAAAVTLHAAAAALGHVLLNVRVRDNLRRTVLRCLGKKVPLADTSIIVSSSAANLSQANRSALAYHSGETGRQLRNIGISASSTTSRSTTKTSSSPYSRSDGQLRHTSTSTSNYNTSASDMPAYLRGFDSSLHNRKDDESRRRRKRSGEGAGGEREGAEGTEGTDSDSDSARSLDLASSHSSDDDETSTRRSSHPPSANRERNGSSSNGGSYLPNITEGAPLGTAPRWPSHIREEGNRPDMGRWSQETGSEQDALSAASPSPNPLPNPLPAQLPPDLTSGVYLGRHRLKPSILENVHDTYVASVDASRLPLDNRYGAMDEELMYGVLPNDTEKQIPYDPNYPMSPTMYRLPQNPYGSKTYLPASRTSEYGYSPTKYLNGDPNVYGSRDFRDSGVTTRDHDGYPSRDFRDSGIATMLKNDYQRKMESHYGGDYNDRMSEGSDKLHTHDKYLFPYTAEEDHIGMREGAHASHARLNTQTGENQQQMAPLATMGETSEKSTTEDDAETRV
ncbi:PREDICTED: protocadherin-like wing polarity protein stan isoform X1 [Papilio xuthus]|uniref:Protocadherin-like wing polarity protein stan isoform X1 n=3 Tax=Papilio xuthus TaxID=66420 RepID=A0AAJ7EHS6_PAPXU|nr:PREDICTED: protocadherin-like wing polarity protein stan isoform X1 [Papilio xuthus]